MPCIECRPIVTIDGNFIYSPGLDESIQHTLCGPVGKHKACYAAIGASHQWNSVLHCPEHSQLIVLLLCLYGHGPEIVGEIKEHLGSLGDELCIQISEGIFKTYWGGELHSIILEDCGLLPCFPPLVVVGK